MSSGIYIRKDSFWLDFFILYFGHLSEKMS